MSSLNKYGVPMSDDSDDRYPMIQPKFKNRFRVFFYNFAYQGTTLSDLSSGGTIEIDEDNVALMGNVVSFNKPNVTYTQVEVRSFIGKGSVSGRPTWENVTITLRDDIKNAVVGFVARQSYLQQQKYMPHSEGFGRNFTFSMMLEVMDGRVGHTGTERWLFSGCTLQNVNYGDLSYEMDTEIQKIELNIMYNNILVYSPPKENLHSNYMYNEMGGGGGSLNGILGEAENSVNDVFGQATSSLMGIVDQGIDAVSGAVGGVVNQASNTVGNVIGQASGAVGDTIGNIRDSLPF